MWKGEEEDTSLNIDLKMKHFVIIATHTLQSASQQFSFADYTRGITT